METEPTPTDPPLQLGANASRRRTRAIALIALLGFYVSGLIYWALWRRERDGIEAAFLRVAYDRRMGVAGEFESGLTLVRSVSAHVRSSDRNPVAFGEFTHHLFSTATTLRALSWNSRVPPSDLLRHVSKEREYQADYTPKQIGPDGSMVEMDLDAIGERSRDYVLVDFIEPLETNRAALGFDITSEPIRRDALNRARDSGDLAATGALRLVQEPERQFGVLVFAPIYRKGAMAATVDQRRESFEGVVVGVYRIGETVEAGIKNLAPGGVDVYLFEENSKLQSRLLHFHPSRSRRGAARPITDLAKLQSLEFSDRSRINFAGRQWTLFVMPTEEFVASRSSWFPLFVFGSGLIGTLLLSAYLTNLSRLTDQLQFNLLQRKEAERSLTKMQHSIDSSRVPVLWVGMDGRFQYANAAATESLGYTPEEIRKVSILDVAPQWAGDSWADRWNEVREPGSVSLQSSLQRKDGTQFPVEIVANFFAYEQDEYIYFQAFDITERNRQQDRLREHEQALSHVSRLSTLGEMVAGIAHEVNQPLSAISMLAGACSRGIDSSNTDSTLPLREWTEQIGEQAVRCGDIIRRLRYFVKKSDAKRCDVNLNEVIEESIALLQSDAWNRSIRIDWVKSSPGPTVQGDRVQLQQVIVNLLRNAYEAVCEGGSKDRRVRVEVIPMDDTVRITVEDHGKGIDRAHLGKMFDAFFTTKPDGMGMGLAISKSIVESHQGRLWAESEAGQGARIHVQLPLTTAPLPNQSESVIAS